MTWTVRVHDAAAKQLKAIPLDRRRRIPDDLSALKETRFGAWRSPCKAKPSHTRLYFFIDPIFRPKIPRNSLIPLQCQSLSHPQAELQPEFRHSPTRGSARGNFQFMLRT